jgi:pimeloyl-ACP methyl ester carboxylesterase
MGQVRQTPAKAGSFFGGKRLSGRPKNGSKTVDHEAADRAKAMQPLFSAEAIEKLTRLDFELNAKLAALIPGGRQIAVEGAGHDIHVDKPDALIKRVADMIKEVREKKGN